MKNNCHKIEKMLTDYLDGNLSEKEMAMVSEHISACPECKAALEAGRQWLEQSRHVAEAAEPSAEDLARMKTKIMQTVRSNEQARRAAHYISVYQSGENSHLPQDKNETADADNRPDDENASDKSSGHIRQGRDSRTPAWLRPPALAGYAAIVVLLFITGFLFGEISSHNNRENLTISGIDVLDNRLSNDMSVKSEGQESVFAEGAQSPDPEMIDSETKELILDPPDIAAETTAVMSTADPVIWTTYNGKLTDLALVSDLFKPVVRDSSDATEPTSVGQTEASGSTPPQQETAADLLASAKAVRILINGVALESIDAADTISPSHSINGSRPAADGQTSEILILAAWSEEEIKEKQLLLESMLDYNSCKYIINRVDSDYSVDELKPKIGDEQYRLWQNQIDENNLEDLSWLVLLLVGG